MKLAYYRTLIFDCDGVVLNSNRIKTAAFYKAALPYGEVAAQKLVDYHVAHGGVSRYEKFSWFLKNVVRDVSEKKLQKLLLAYEIEVRQGLLNCDVAPGLSGLREKTGHANWLIVSGGDQTELRDIFVERKLAPFFDGGIFGSPDNKDEILSREIERDNIRHPALFIGDSKYDYQAATRAGLDFIFLYGWTEVKDWESWTISNNLRKSKSIAELI